MVIALDGKGEATRNLSVPSRVWHLQRAARKHRFLHVVEGNRAELFPVANQLVFFDYLMNGKLALAHTVSVYRVTLKRW